MWVLQRGWSQERKPRETKAPFVSKGSHPSIHPLGCSYACQDFREKGKRERRGEEVRRGVPGSGQNLV